MRLPEVDERCGKRTLAPTEKGGASMAPASGYDFEDGAGRRERVAAIDAVGTVAGLLERAADAMDRSGRPKVAASHRQVAKELRADA